MLEGTKPWDLDFHTHVWGEELEAFSLEQGNEIGTLLFGRRTFEGMAAHWTKATGPIAEMMNGIAKAVASRTFERAGWNNTRLLKGDAVDAVAKRRPNRGKDVFVFGSADLLGSLLGAGLVDGHRRPLWFPFRRRRRADGVRGRPPPTSSREPTHT